MKLKERIAQLVSNILFNPGLLALVILIASVLKSSMSRIENICWMVAIAVLNGIIPGAFYLFFTSRGYVFDDTLHNKKVHRERILLIGLFLILATLELLILVSSSHFYQPLLAVLVGGIVAIVFSGIISYFWKISIHSLMVTFFVTAIILVFGWRVWPVILFIPLVWWSRLVLYRHTIWQLLGGFLMSLVIVYGVFECFGLI